jgi:phenylalanyl-tRNA synthetase beta chain
LPPIINSEKTKITLGTKNVFIEITGTDIMKTRICLAILASQFSEYSKGEWKHKIEQVKINYEGHPEKDEISPALDYNTFEVEIAKVNSLLGLKLDAAKISECAEKMGLKVIGSSENGQLLKVEVPPTRADILHACDVAEDIGIGYGFNNIQKTYPKTATVGSF